MKKVACIVTLVILFLSMFLLNRHVFATRWVKLKAHEVNDRADVIVMGTYDFSSKPKSSKLIFQGLAFNVKKVYQGDSLSKTIIGIDEHDIPWAQNFQHEDSEFLMFLEKSDKANFLVPVAGPNGMIQILNGIVEKENKEDKMFYEDLLKTQPYDPSAEKDDIAADGPYSTSKALVYTGAILVTALLFFIIYRKLKKQQEIRDV